MDISFQAPTTRASVPVSAGQPLPVSPSVGGAAVGTGNPMPVSGGQISTGSVTIANGASLSGALDCGLARLARINMPAAWTAAVLTFQTSPDGVTYLDFYDQFGAEYTVQAAASRSIGVNLVDFLGVRFIKVRSGTAAAAVSQGAARDLTLVLVP